MDWKQELLKRLDALASSLGTTAQYLWTVLVRQGYVEGITDVGVAALLIALAGVSLYYMKKALRMPNDEGDWSDEKIGLFTPFVIVGPISVCVAVTFLYTGVQELLNPQFYALQKLLETLK